MAQIDPTGWDAYLSSISNPHILQTYPWGKLKAEFGWRVFHIISDDAGAQVLVKRILPGINFAYIPKGPVGMNTDHLWPEINIVCKQNKCAFLKIEADRWQPDELNDRNNSDIFPNEFFPSKQSIQPRRTLMVDLSTGEEQILARMKQKTRYNINLAVKKNVVVKSSDNIGAFYDLMKVTGQRDQFGIHSPAYYQRAYALFHLRGECQLLIAEYDGMPISGVMVFKVGERAWYFYGASSSHHRERMPNYLLQWEAIKWAKSQGCKEYDLWGVPDHDIDTLEESFTSRHDGLWSVYRFKRGFGGILKRSVDPLDRVYNPLVYRLYSLWIRYRNTAS